jgi:hypothetical protein
VLGKNSGQDVKYNMGKKKRGIPIARVAILLHDSTFEACAIFFCNNSKVRDCEEGDKLRDPRLLHGVCRQCLPRI